MKLDGYGQDRNLGCAVGKWSCVRARWPLAYDLCDRCSCGRCSCRWMKDFSVLSCRERTCLIILLILLDLCAIHFFKNVCAAVDFLDFILMNLFSWTQMDTTLPPVQKLVVPSVASMSGNRSMSFRPTLTPGGASRPLDKVPTETVRNAVLPESIRCTSLFPYFLVLRLIPKGLKFTLPTPKFYTEHPIMTMWKAFWGFWKFS